MCRKIITFLIISSLWLPCAVAREADDSLIDSLWNVLREKNTPDDSIKILYNIFDLSRRGERPTIAKKIYSCAVHAGDNRTRLDICRQMGNMFYRNDSAINVILQSIADIPSGPDRTETEVFVRLMNTTAHAAECTPEQVNDSLHAIIKILEPGKAGSVDDGDIYADIEPLYKFCLFLGYSSRGDLLTDTYDRLGTLIEKTPDYPGALQSMFNVSSGIAYAGNQLYEKAFVAERKVLETIDGLQERYAREGRPYRNYDTNKYTSYRRILACFPSMTTREVQDYYDRILALSACNEDIANDLHNVNFRPTIYYLLANRRYQEAIPLIKSYLAKDKEPQHRGYMLKYLKDAAKAVGDSATLLRAALDYSDLLEERAKEKIDERTRGMQILYEVTNLRQDNDRLEISRQQERIDWQYRMLIIVIVAGALLLLMLVIVWRFYVSARHLGEELKSRNNELKVERDALRETRESLIEARDRAKAADRKKTDFINTMSHDAIVPVNTIVEYTSLIADCVEADRRPYVHRFADIIKMNSRILLSLVNQTLDVAAIENSVVDVNKENTGVDNMCRTAVETIKSSVSPGVEILYINNCEEGQTVCTDSARVGQVLNNLLSNAAKFTRSGHIKLESSIAPDGERLVITVTDTGSGIPASKADVIFDRFEKLDNEVEGYGLGLYISRLVARILGGTLELDTTYSRGARFIFTIPLR